MEPRQARLLETDAGKPIYAREAIGMGVAPTMRKLVADQIRKQNIVGTRGRVGLSWHPVRPENDMRRENYQSVSR